MSCSTAFSNTLTRVFSPKASEDIVHSGELLTIFAAHQLQEKCQEQYSDLFVTFVDLYEGLRHGQQRWLMEDPGEVRLPQQVHHNCPAVS